MGGGRQGASCSAKNCIDTRGGRREWGTEGRVEGGGRGGLSCGSGGAVSVSETGPSRNQPVSVSERAAGEWRRLRSRVYHTASVYVRASMRAGDFILPEAGERSGHTLQKIFCHTLVPACRAVAMMTTMVMMMEWRENGERSGTQESGNQIENQKSNQIQINH